MIPIHTLEVSVSFLKGRIFQNELQYSLKNCHSYLNLTEMTKTRHASNPDESSEFEPTGLGSSLIILDVNK